MKTFTNRQLSIVNNSTHILVSCHYTPQGECRVKFEGWTFFKKIGSFTAPWDYSLNNAQEVAIKRLDAAGFDYVANGGWNAGHYTIIKNRPC